MKTTTSVAIASAVLWMAAAGRAHGQQPAPIDTRHSDFNAVLGFETASGDALPAPWTVSGNATIEIDRAVVHSGDAAARFDLGESASGISGLILRIPVDFEGTKIELRGYLRGENVSRRAPLFGNQGSSDTALVDPIAGTRDWTEFRETAPIDPNAHTLELGVQFSGQGTIWADDLEIFVDGRPLHEVPRVEGLTAGKRNALIARAESAGPPSIARNASIKTVYGGAIEVLREGSNGWTCWGETLGLGPMCNDPGWDAWLMAYWNNEEAFEVDRFSVSYMLAAAGEPPHVMILLPKAEMLDGLPTEGAVWAMWRDRPYAHIMLNTGDDIGPGPAVTGFGFASMQRLTLPPRPFIAFEPIDLSRTNLERYAGTYAARELPRGLADLIPEEQREQFLVNTTVTVTIDENALVFQRQLGERQFSDTYRPASETRFIQGQDEILFEFDDEGRVIRFLQQTGIGNEWMAHERIE
jgi:hypothetical protein